MVKLTEIELHVCSWILTKVKVQVGKRESLHCRQSREVSSGALQVSSKLDSQLLELVFGIGRVPPAGKQRSNTQCSSINLIRKERKRVLIAVCLIQILVIFQPLSEERSTDSGSRRLIAGRGVHSRRIPQRRSTVLVVQESFSSRAPQDPWCCSVVHSIVGCARILQKTTKMNNPHFFQKKTIKPTSAPLFPVALIYGARYGAHLTPTVPPKSWQPASVSRK